MPRWPKKVEGSEPQPATETTLDVKFPNGDAPDVVPKETLAVNPVVVAIERTSLLMPLFDEIVKANEQDSRRVAARNGIVKALTWLKQIEGGNK